MLKPMTQPIASLSFVPASTDQPSTDLRRYLRACSPTSPPKPKAPPPPKSAATGTEFEFPLSGRPVPSPPATVTELNSFSWKLEQLLARVEVVDPILKPGLGEWWCCFGALKDWTMERAAGVYSGAAGGRSIEGGVAGIEDRWRVGTWKVEGWVTCNFSTCLGLIAIFL